MSVWDTYSGSVSLPPGTPNIEIRMGVTGLHRVVVDGATAHGAPTYRECHRWVQNEYRLTSTMMLPVYADYEASLPDALEMRGLYLGQSAEAPEGGSEQKPPNKYRRPVTT